MLLQYPAYQRTCDFCGNKYTMNNKEIPRLIITKKVDIDDLTSKDFIASPDYCGICMMYIIRWLGKKSPIHFSFNPYYTKPVITVNKEKED